MYPVVYTSKSCRVFFPFAIYQKLWKYLIKQINTNVFIMFRSKKKSFFFFLHFDSLWIHTLSKKCFVLLNSLNLIWSNITDMCFNITGFRKLKVASPWILRLDHFIFYVSLPLFHSMFIVFAAKKGITVQIEIYRMFWIRI